MIEEHIQGEMTALFKELPAAGGDMTKVDPVHFPVLNMLNTRYFISRFRVVLQLLYSIRMPWVTLGL